MQTDFLNILLWLKVMFDRQQKLKGWSSGAVGQGVSFPFDSLMT